MEIRLRDGFGLRDSNQVSKMRAVKYSVGFNGVLFRLVIRVRLKVF